MRCLVLFSGSLESLLAAKLMQEQGIEPIGLFFATLCSRNEPPVALADRLGMRLNVVEQDADYCEAIRHPTLGRTRQAAACLDCRVHLLRQTKLRLPETDASFLVSGEVIGQRPQSQNRPDLDAVAYHAQVEDLLVRPLSARLLPETLPEREKWIDRGRLYAFHGNAHQGMLELARGFGWNDLPASRPGCGLTDRAVSARVFDHLQHTTGNDPAEFNLLAFGRHFRFDEATKVVVGRNKSENEQLLEFAASHPLTPALGKPANFAGPAALILGEASPASRAFASALLARFGKPTTASPAVEWRQADETIVLEVQPNDQAAAATAIGAQ